MDVPVTHDLASDLVWPRDGVTRVPFRVFSDPAIYAEEQKRLFRGPIWNFLCLEIEIPNPGDWRLATVGEMPVVVTRDEHGDDPCDGEPLRAQGRAGVPAGARQRQGADLRVSFVELRSRRPAAERRVPPRRARQGRHAGGFRRSAASPGAAARRGVLRPGVRHVLRCDGAGGRRISARRWRG